jgi:hypothetical protein
MFAPPANKNTLRQSTHKIKSPIRQTNQKTPKTNQTTVSSKNIKFTSPNRITHKNFNLNKIASIRTLPPFAQVISGSNSQNKSSECS